MGREKSSSMPFWQQQKNKQKNSKNSEDYIENFFGRFVFAF